LIYGIALASGLTMCFREQSLSGGCDIDGVNHLDHPTLCLLIVVVMNPRKSKR
jgi:hypothetical protein